MSIADRIKNWIKPSESNQSFDDNSVQECVRRMFLTQTPDKVSYYCSEDPVNSQIYIINDSRGDNICRISSSRRGKDSRIIVRQHGKFVLVGLYKGDLTKRTISNWTGIPEKSFSQEYTNLSGDTELRRILTEMIGPKDTVYRLSESHWEIRRRYDSGNKRWAEILILTNSKSSRTEGFYTVRINLGRDTRTFIKTKEYPANYPYRIIRENVTKFRDNVLFVED